jgi:gamma-glutamyl-gamma-aminobutyrate hydrolase PuuD
MLQKTGLIYILFLSIFTANAQIHPLIGLADTYKDGTTTVPRSYIDAILNTDGIPVLIPLMRDDEKLVELLKSLDGLIFVGGGDFDPAYYAEKPIPQMGKINAPRDTFEIRLLRHAAAAGVPVLGICRGLQLINITFGGSLYQDIPVQHYDKSISHRQKQPTSLGTHSVIIENDSEISKIVKEKMLWVNSAHHQAVKRLAEGFHVSGKSPDGIIEVIEKVDSVNWIMGVQFHPEQMISKDKALMNIFKGFIEVASKIK